MEEKEILIRINSTIEHEIIHAVLDKYIDTKTCCLFDLIAKKIRSYNFPEFIKIMEKYNLIFKSQEEIKREINRLFNLYGYKEV